MTKPAASTRPGGGQATEGLWPGIFAGLFGALLGLSLLKFGNPVILEKYIAAPTGFWEFVIDPWPESWGHWFLAIVVLAGLFTMRWKRVSTPLIAVLPLLWLIWEGISAMQTVNAPLTRATLEHFWSCVLCFYLGLFALSEVRNLWPFWTGLLAGFALVLVIGFDQHFGGLEQTRRFFQLYYPDPAKVAPEMLARLNSKRIFSTLFYANTLASVILLLLPVTLALIGSLKFQLTVAARRFVIVLVGLAALVCLYWSGSKGGWLLMLIIGLVAAMFLPFKRQWKLALVGTALVLGLAGFFVKYAGFFKRGAPSVGARFDYWEAALQTTRDKPLLGTGPGTFGVTYEKIKKPTAEMARMAHNDYLQQASDSGVVGFLLYAGLVIGSLVVSFRRAGLRQDWVKLTVWLGLLGWALHSLMEFGLYIPAIAWPAFAFMGWLLGCGSNHSTDASGMAKVNPRNENTVS